MTSEQLVIFDMDGTLVDSEHCSAQALLDVFPELNDTRDNLVRRYRGLKLENIFNDIAQTCVIELPADIRDQYRAREAELGSTLIRGNPGVELMLARLQSRYCIASNAPRSKTQRSLSICGLARWFDQNIYSAYDVQSWKPDPALLRHAAENEGFSCEQCVVVEDSDAGLQAAVGAGMRPIFYNPHRRKIAHKGITSIHQLAHLLDLLP